MNKHLFFTLKTIYYMFLYLILSLFFVGINYIFNTHFPNIAYANYESFIKYSNTAIIGIIFLMIGVMFVITLYLLICFDINYFRKTKQYKLKNILKLKHEVNEESKL